jgi:protein tyrosine phosphatase (PTP) superfamily phosphohydrolase (DUF442 family)
MGGLLLPQKHCHTGFLPLSIREVTMFSFSMEHVVAVSLRVMGVFALLVMLPSADPVTAAGPGTAGAPTPAATAAGVSCSIFKGLPPGARASERVFGLPGLRNVGRVAPGVFRGAMPAREGYETLKRMGIRTVINLRTTESERKRVEGAGMRSVEISISMLNSVDRDTVDKIVAMMADPANQPVFVHCKLGQDRTGIVIAAYRMKVEGWPLALAEAEMDSFGFNDQWVHLKRFLHRYATDLNPGKQGATAPGGGS